MTNDGVAYWLWRGGLRAMTLALVSALVLIIALSLGWNSPRPTRYPDWQAADFPLNLEVALDETVVSLLGCPGGDFTFESQAAPILGPDFNGYGLVYRAQDADHYYAFGIGSDGYYAVLRVAGKEEEALVDWQQFPHIHRGRQNNRLRVSCLGAICRFYINDEYAISVEDAAWLAGDVGLWVRGFEEEKTMIQFLSARVWRGMRAMNSLGTDAPSEFTGKSQNAPACGWGGK